MTKQNSNRVTYSYDQYEDYSNYEIKILINDIKILRDKEKLLCEQLYIMRQKCVHQYKFYSNGAYEDTYVCSLCGYETER